MATLNQLYGKQAKKEEEKKPPPSAGSILANAVGSEGLRQGVNSAISTAAPEIAEVGAVPAIPEIAGSEVIPGAASELTGAGLGTLGSIALPAAALYAGWRGLSDYNQTAKDPSFSHGFSNAIKNPANIPLNMMTFGGYSAAQGLLGAAGDAFGSSKSADQIQREGIKDSLKGSGLYDDNYILTNPDGSTFDAGKDGGARIANAAGEKRRYHEWDMNDPRAIQAVNYTNPLGEIVTGASSDDLRSGIVGGFANAASTGTGDVKANARSYYDKLGIDLNSAVSSIDQELADKKITQEEHDVYKANLNDLFGGQATTPTAIVQQSSNRGSSSSSGSSKIPKTKVPPAFKPNPRLSLEDILPAQNKPPAMPEPDDVPSEAERNSVNSYEETLRRMLAKSGMK